MFDLGWTEITIIFIIALMIVGPKDLPKVVRGISRGIARVRGMAKEFRSGFDEIMAEAELDDITKEFNNLKQIKKNPMALTEAGPDDMFAGTGKDDPKPKDDAQKAGASEIEDSETGEAEASQDEAAHEAIVSAKLEAAKKEVVDQESARQDDGKIEKTPARGPDDDDAANDRAAAPADAPKASSGGA